MAGGDRSWLDDRRWYTVECFDSRDEALAFARKYRRSNAFGKGRAFRVHRVMATGGRWCVEHAAELSPRDRERGAYYNRKAIETERGQRKLFG